MRTLFSIIGQESLQEKLHQVDQAGRHANSYLLYGQDGVGKEALALEFAAIMNCQSESEKPCGECRGCIQMRTLQHPNLHLIYALPGGGSGSDPLKGLSEDIIENIHASIQAKSENPYRKIRIKNAQNIKIASIRSMQKTVHLGKATQGRKVVLIFEAERMNKAAFNSILKIVEEPPEETSFIFTTNALHQIPETIRSRSQQVPLRLLTEEEVFQGLQQYRSELDDAAARQIAKLASGDFGFALDLAEKDLLALENQVLDFIRAAMQGNPVAIREQASMLEKLSVLERNRFLHLVQLWFRDADRLAETGREDDVLFTSTLDKIQGFVDYYPGMNYQSAQILLESSIDYIERNVYPRLALVSLLVQLHQAVQGELEDKDYGSRQRYQSNYLRGV